MFLCRLVSLTEIFASCAARFARCYLGLSCHFHTLLPFTCADDSCLSVMHAGVATVVNFAIHTVFLGRPSSSASTFLQLSFALFAAVFCFVWLCASWSAGTPRLRPVCALNDRSTRPVEPYCSLSLVLQALPVPFRRLPLMTLSRQSCLCTWRLTCLWTDVRIFQHLCTASD